MLLYSCLSLFVKNYSAQLSLFTIKKKIIKAYICNLLLKIFFFNKHI